MSPSPATSDAIGVLVVDSNRLQAQLLTSALRRHPEFRIATCSMDIDSLLRAFASSHLEVALLSPNSFAGNAESMAVLRQFHFSYPEVSKVLLVESCDREFVISAFRSGVRGIFCL